MIAGVDRKGTIGKLNGDAARDLLRAAIEKAGGQAQLAKAWGVTRPLISKQLNGKVPIHGTVLDRLGLVRHRMVITTYDLKPKNNTIEQESVG